MSELSPCQNCGGMNCRWSYGPFCEAIAIQMMQVDGARILAPGQLDPYTIERCAEVAQYGGCTSSGCDVRYGENAASWHSDLCPSGIATRIRALARKEGE